MIWLMARKPSVAIEDWFVGLLASAVLPSVSSLVQMWRFESLQGSFPRARPVLRICFGGLP